MVELWNCLFQVDRPGKSSINSFEDKYTQLVLVTVVSSNLMREVHLCDTLLCNNIIPDILGLMEEFETFKITSLFFMSMNRLNKSTSLVSKISLFTENHSRFHGFRDFLIEPKIPNCWANINRKG